MIVSHHVYLRYILEFRFRQAHTHETNPNKHNIIIYYYTQLKRLKYNFRLAVSNAVDKAIRVKNLGGLWGAKSMFQPNEA